MMTLVAMLTIAAPGKAMSYEQARNEALFLTDKMAYELNLTDEQYEAAYEINLDYLMGVTSYDDVYATYWERRNLDMSYVLLDWQWQAFCAATYFYRPLYWEGGYWHFGIYARYPHRDYFYFGRPVFYASYRGAHAWHRVGGHGWYHARRDHFRPVGRSHFGMLDRWNRGDYRSAHHSGGRYSSYGGRRISSTRHTVHNGQRSHEYSRNQGYSRNHEYSRNQGYSRNHEYSRNQGYSRNNEYNRGSRPSAAERPSTTRRPSSYSGGSHSSGSFSGGRTYGGGSASFGGSHSGGSRSSGAFSGGRSSSHGGGGHSSSGGRSFGGRR